MVGTIDEGEICSVNYLSDTVLSIASTVDGCREEAAEICFLNVLLKWGNMWLWEDLTVEGDENWLEQSIPAGSVVAVTDESYQKELYPNISSAGSVLECKQGRGQIHDSLVEQSSEACAYRG